ncbi:MAG: ATP-binding cassette domain-containing protein [Truepera sp.]|nr:ATP-binding cassette domain-containing protein [Truepera sp.]
MTLLIEGLSHRFGQTEVLTNIELRLSAGEAVALVGPSGCGKTTLLNLIAGLLRPSAGRIENGYPATSYLFQQPCLLPWQTALDNIALGLKARGMPRRERQTRARGLGHQLGLTDADLKKYPSALSGGMKSRVALARAWALEPELLLLDEPFSALDVGLKAELYNLLLDQLMARGTSLLLVTHDLMEAVRLADRLLMMAPCPGRIVGEFKLERPRLARDEMWVYQATARFMQAPEVRAGFGLPPSGQDCAEHLGASSQAPADMVAAASWR